MPLCGVLGDSHQAIRGHIITTETDVAKVWKQENRFSPSAKRATIRRFGRFAPGNSQTHHYNENRCGKSVEVGIKLAYPARRPLCGTFGDSHQAIRGYSITTEKDVAKVWKQESNCVPAKHAIL